ncbi:DUF2799 domain-containing protein [Bdellovibrio sp. HCB337]|uniref:DUF2799 domain-containing protein n=1 Tax=Bdellovibrio sp. HCB337 TaxID=3394358 RepID=UPI0039A63753
MKKKMGFWLLTVSVLFITACANWELKERCEKTNWFEYSQTVAFQGKYLEEDAFIKECKGVDRTSAVQLDLGFKQGREKMCQYDEIHARGKEGTPVFFKFCDGLEMNRMKQLFAQGLEFYCTAEAGYSFAKKGKVYQNLCNPQQEKAFLPGYYRGRKEYLTSYMGELQTRLSEVKTLEASYAITAADLQREYSTLPDNAKDCSSKMVYNETTKESESQYVCEEAFYIRSRRDHLWSEMDKIRSKLYVVRNDWKTTEANIAQTQRDLNEMP